MFLFLGYWHFKGMEDGLVWFKWANGLGIGLEKGCISHGATDWSDRGSKRASTEGLGNTCMMHPRMRIDSLQAFHEIGGTYHRLHQKLKN